MDTFLDYIAWISIALTVSTILFLFLATCLLLGQAAVHVSRWTANSRIDVSRLSVAMWQAGVKFRHEAAHLMKQQPKLGAYIHLHSGGSKPRA